jgi:hypothetical protein
LAITEILVKHSLIRVSQDELQLEESLKGNKNILLPSIQILDMIEDSNQGSTPTLSQLAPQTPKKSSPSLKYVHKEHKFRIQAFIVRMLKKEDSVNVEELHERVLKRFSLSDTPSDLVLDLSKENILKNIEDLIEKEFLTEDKDLNLYTYER